MILDLEGLLQVSAQILARPLPAYRRYLFPRLESQSPLIGIKGARGAGKSTLLLQQAKARHLSPNQLLYASCDHPAMVGQSLYALAEAFHARGGQLLMLDEVHKAADFSRQLKAIHDVFDLKVFFSGSSAMELEHASADLSRRAVVHELALLSFREFCELETGLSLPVFSLRDLLDNHLAIAAELIQGFRPLELFASYLTHGCYPFYRESVADYPLKLQQVISLTIDSDLSRIFNIDSSKLDRLKKILYMLCTTNPYELNISKLSAGAEVSWPTLQKYLHYMQAGSLIHLLRGGSGMRAVNRPAKMLLHNPNLFAVLCASGNKGTIRESFFIAQTSHLHQVHYHDQGDFLLDDEWVFEIGGADKPSSQLKDQQGFIAADDIQLGSGRRIPLWLFGFLY